jgi:hypothetical protein
MAIQHTSEIKKIDVIPSHAGRNNVIKRIVWEITFIDPEINVDVESKTIACAILDTDSIEEFTSINNVTDEQILEWGYSQHGGIENFIPMITPLHIEELQRKADCFGLQEYSRELQQTVESTNEYDGLF